MTRFVRRIAALAAIAALAFAQLAVSAYACPLEAPAQPAAATAGVDCDEIVSANLCEQHCDYGSSSVGFAALAIPALPAACVPWRLESGAAPASAGVTLDRQFLASHPPPPLILFGVLRI